MSRCSGKNTNSRHMLAAVLVVERNRWRRCVRRIYVSSWGVVTRGHPDLGRLLVVPLSLKRWNSLDTVDLWTPSCAATLLCGCSFHQILSAWSRCFWRSRSKAISNRAHKKQWSIFIGKWTIDSVINLSKYTFVTALVTRARAKWNIAVHGFTHGLEKSCLERNNSYAAWLSTAC